jgi:hypothetical protein
LAFALQLRKKHGKTSVCWGIWVFVERQTRELTQDVKSEDQQVMRKKQHIK